MRRRSRRRITGNTVIHVPSTIATSLANGTSFVTIVASPSINAAGSASSNIEAQDKDRTVNVGHHVGRLNLDLNIRNTIGDGVVEFCVYKVERQATTPTIGNHPIPSSAEINTQGIQQACRLANPGKVFHYSKKPYSVENTQIHKIIVSPAKYKLSKMKAGDYWILQVFNRGPSAVTIDYEGRFKEYE